MDTEMRDMAKNYGRVAMNAFLSFLITSCLFFIMTVGDVRLCKSIINYPVASYRELSS
jgi:hypothetical protein